MLINNLLMNTCNNVTYFPLTVNSKRFRDVNSFSPPCIMCASFKFQTVSSFSSLNCHCGCRSNVCMARVIDECFKCC